MHPAGIAGWMPGQPTAVIDLGEEFAPDPSNASTAALQFSAAYYAVDSSAEGNGSKKRKVERACDFCRRRKARCDGPRMPDNICSNCITNSRSCTYVESSKPRGPPKAYVVGLEDRVERMEALLKRLRPETDFSEEIGPPIVRDSWKTEGTPLLEATDKALSSSPKPEHSPTISTKGSLASLTAPPPNRARVNPSALGGNMRTRNGRGDRATRSSQPRKRSDDASDSDHDASCSSLSDSSEEDEAGELSIVSGMKRLTMRGLEPAEVSPERHVVDNQLRFHGKSSSFKLISTTRGLIQQHINETSSEGRQSNSPGDIPLPPPPSRKRPQFWQIPTWEQAFENADDPTRIPDWLLPGFPPPDLADKLIRDYFELNSNTFPLLHRPTFERHWRDQIHTKNVWFACVCLGIFGIASRWSSDPRVLPDGVVNKVVDDKEQDLWSLAGWRFVILGAKIHESRRSVLCPPELFEIQSFVLIAQYFRGSVVQAGSWFYLSVGLIKAQDVGAHRRKIYGCKPTVEEELWKRAYWHLVAFDRVGSMLLGRPCCSREEDLDLDLPIEVDDEYWENDDPELAFRQPEGKPALISSFLEWIKLSHIIAYALKTLYTSSKTKAGLGLTGARWKEQTIEKLNDALLKWAEEVPAHLRWKSDMQDRAFASQAATLHTTYHMIQILIYRPFIRVPHAPSRGRLVHHSPMSSKAMSICLNSVRASNFIMDVQTRRGMLNVTNVLHVSFFNAGVLLVHFWDLVRQFSSHRSQEVRALISHEASTAMGEISAMIARLEDVAQRWELAREML
ncbi:fungal-specific transcription factor domain-containing protein [Epithele typhae]|uniref:fungal-specific transcription factor domain-containing protein n=1 Tax=Epithele typhae TaxID=378194 RepID=UPI002007C596|nr:fungal-specific transcription factor domain-containing protein [Epithele typhae]KAH9929511.1 fungal-specific transcription factor domain-containing protein [Epithele typhae]